MDRTTIFIGRSTYLSLWLEVDRAGSIPPLGSIFYLTASSLRSGLRRGGATRRASLVAAPCRLRLSLAPSSFGKVLRIEAPFSISRLVRFAQASDGAAQRAGLRLLLRHVAFA